MRLTLLERVTLEKGLIYIIIIAVLLVFGFIFYLFFAQFTRSIEVLSPNGAEEWEISQTYEITWKARGIDKVGIVIFKGTEPKWIARDIHADLGRYEWKIYPGQEFGDDYWIAVFEYPWQKRNKVDYSDGAFAVTYPEFASCDGIAIENEWPYVADDRPNLRRVFITEQEYTGNLGGLDGADRKCQEQAEKLEYGGTWQAFLGGDSDDDLAVERIKKTPRGTNGVYIEARPSATLIKGSTCHRLLGSNFSEFLKRFTELSVVSQEKLESGFLGEFKNVWLGRFDEKSKKNCTGVETALNNPHVALAEKYSFTTTCQNWSAETMTVEGYPSGSGEAPAPFPTCYAPGGVFTKAVILGGLATGLADDSITPYQGKYCNDKQKLICIEQ